MEEAHLHIIVMHVIMIKGIMIKGIQQVEQQRLTADGKQGVVADHGS